MRRSFPNSLRYVGGLNYHRYVSSNNDIFLSYFDICPREGAFFLFDKRGVSTKRRKTYSDSNNKRMQMFLFFPFFIKEFYWSWELCFSFICQLQFERHVWENLEYKRAKFISCFQLKLNFHSISLSFSFSSLIFITHMTYFSFTRFGKFGSKHQLWRLFLEYFLQLWKNW